MQKISSKQKIILIILGLFLSVILLEIGLRIGGFVLLSLQEYRNRISIKQRGTYRIICLGESTTALGGKDSYPSQLEEVLNQRGIGIKFSVINKGVCGTDTGKIMLQLKDNLGKYTPDMVITMMGINDREGAMAYEDTSIKKTILFIKSFRTYKLVKLLRLHIANKVKEMRIYRLLCRIHMNLEHSRPHVKLGRYYRDQGRYDGVEEMFKRAIETNPKNSEAYSGLGRYYRDQGRHEEAGAMFKKAIDLEPENYNLYVKLGQCYRDQGKYEQAEEMFKRAIEINPENDKLYSKLAICYGEQGKNKSAEEYFRKADRLRLGTYNITRHNYQRLKEMVTQRGIRLICVQYPMRGVEPLKKMLKSHNGIIFVDNEKIFIEALKQAIYEEYFTDIFGGDFGHGTRKGNRLLAENIAQTIIKEVFKQNTK